MQHINKNMLTIQTTKTREVVRIPLSDKALTLIDAKKGRLFIVYQNWKENKILSEISKISRLKKKITFHVARHTFATISLNLGIPIEVVSCLLGHTSIKTTQIYTKILNSTKVSMMQKWDKKFS